MSNSSESNKNTPIPDCSNLFSLHRWLNQKNSDLLQESTSEIMSLVLEYAKLASLPRLSELEESRFEEILTVAEDNEIVHFWLTEIDHVLGHYLGLLDEDDRESYRDQQAVMKEYAGVIESFPIPKDKQIKNYLEPLHLIKNQSLGI